MSLKPALTDTDRLRHMRDAACAAQRFVQGRSRTDLDTDEMVNNHGGFGRWTFLEVTDPYDDVVDLIRGTIAPSAVPWETAP